MIKANEDKPVEWNQIWNKRDAVGDVGLFGAFGGAFVVRWKLVRFETRDDGTVESIWQKVQQ